MSETKSEFLASFLKRKASGVATTSSSEVEIPEETEEEILAKRKKLEYLSETRRISVYKLITNEACMHEVAVPPDCEFVPLTPLDRPPAKKFPFTLDPFQREAMMCIDHNVSVLVSAHTSAGKTAVAEYAIASALRDKQRVIYTTPIKALSNQKYREFSDEFSDVGLLTGDVTVNPNASVLIMTTEILRSMLYRGSDIIREIGWVVFDEIHYMRDASRGVVWEESIILLPHRVRYVFLSATIPNACQFAQWISALHNQVCHVVYTDFRPVPLQHYIYPMSGSGIILVVNEKGEFVERNFLKAMSYLSKDSDSNRQMRFHSQRDQNNFCTAIIRLIIDKNLEPVIVFSFSKKECELYALKIAELDFITPEEKQIVHEVFHQAIDMLSDDDKRLPQVENILPLLKRGIGIHHSGLLPILKETVEILFSEGLIKCLFATETFAMGLNMPARTVLFTSARKYDGKSYRWITSGEYIQMSGRAGRRGKDERGIAIVVVDERMSDKAAREIVQGSPDALNSAFYLSYNMVLNLMRVEEVNPEFMMQRSFHQFQNRASLPHLQADQLKLKRELESIHIEDEDTIAAYYNLGKHVNSLREDVMTIIRKPKYIVPFLQSGRLVHITKGDDDFGWGVVVALKQKAFGPDKRALSDAKKETKTKENQEIVSSVFYVLDCLLSVPKQFQMAASTEADLGTVPTTLTMTTQEVAEDDIPAATVKPSETQKVEKELCIVPVQLSCIHEISAVRLLVPKDLRPASAKKELMDTVPKVCAKLGGRLPQLDPLKDMKIDDPLFESCLEKLATYEKRLEVHSMHNNADLDSLMKQYEGKLQKQLTLKSIEDELVQKTELISMSELKARKRVLRRLKYCTESDVVELKGRVACEISSADELIMTELLFDGEFNRWSVVQIGALLTCFVFEEKTNMQLKMSEDLSEPLRTLQNTARRIASISRECGLPGMDDELYVGKINPGMMVVMKAWLEGSSFSLVSSMTDIYEGSIVRSIRRTQEVIRDLVNAAKTIGNKELEDKFIECSTVMKRGIVFAASLYI